MYDDRQQWGSEITTEASDIYNVYYPVMEAQVVTDNNGKAFISYIYIYIHTHTHTHTKQKQTNKHKHTQKHAHAHARTRTYTHTASKLQCVCCYGLFHGAVTISTVYGVQCWDDSEEELLTSSNLLEVATGNNGKHQSKWRVNLPRFETRTSRTHACSYPLSTFCASYVGMVRRCSKYSVSLKYPD
jgi:ABC-type Zn2+ transport system substrate-binding protein/surface adhesin